MKVIWAEENFNDVSFATFLKIKFDDGTAKVFQCIQSPLASTYINVETGVRYSNFRHDDTIPDYIREAYKLIEQDRQVKYLKKLQETAAKIKWTQ